MTEETAAAKAVDPLLHLLWPDGVGSHTDYRSLPDDLQPRMLIPRVPPEAGITLLRALRDASTPRSRIRTRALVAAWRSPLAPGKVVRLPSGGVTEHLHRHFDQPVFIGVHLGPPRANRKPVLAVCSTSGELLGFVKIGVNSLTDRLVQNEALALELVGGLATVSTPSLRWHDQWAGHPLIIQSPVSRSGRPVADNKAVTAAQVEVANALGTEIGGATYLNGVRARLEHLETTLDERDLGAIQRLTALTHHLDDSEPVADVICGSWHGDWRVTNMAVRRDAVSVWDWERFARDVPLGFDALHLLLTTMAPKTPHAASLVPALFARAARALAPFGVRSPAVAETVTALYLVELATRYLEDAQARSGARLGDVTTWLLPSLETRLQEQV